MTPPAQAPGSDRAPRVPDHALRAGLLAGVAYVLVGWRALLVPSLIRLVAPSFDQSDAGMGGYFLATALAYGIGSGLGGRTIAALGSRLVIPGALLLVAVALLAQGLTDAWPVFLGAGVLAGIGASMADVGINALVLDLFPRSRGRALNLLHVSYGAGALLAPLGIAAAVGAGVHWPWILLGSGIAVAVAAVGLGIAVPGHPIALPGVSDAAVPAGDTRRLPLFLLAMAVSVVGYVGAEAGVSNWLVRFLHDLPQAQASLALTLFWAGIAGGRLAFARLGNRTQPERAATLLSLSSAVLLLVALGTPVGALSPVLFGAVGLAFGPVFPLFVAAAGARMPGRSATVSGTLIFAAVVGAVVYPPAIGFLSEVVGLQAAMLGTVAMALVCSGAAWAARRLPA